MREGLLPHTVTAVLRFSTDETKARAVTELLGEMLDPTETAVAAFETETKATASPWVVEVYFADEPDHAAILDLIGPTLGQDVSNAVFTAVEAKDWVRASLEGLNPVRAGRFLVHGGHDRSSVRSNDIGIEIEAGLAFGTGHHGTTAGCLAAIDAVMKRRRPRHVIDVGTGTGLLAIAAAKRLKARVTAGDIDAVAVEVSRDNARLNGAGALVSLYVGPGVRHHAAGRSRHFDLVVANILAGPLKRLAPSLARVLAGHGDLILSGLLVQDVPGVLAAYRHQGLGLARRSEREGWATLVLRRGGASPRRRA